MCTLTNVLWHSAAVDDVQVDQYIEKFHIPPRIARWLCMRGVAEHEVVTWLDPTVSDWSDPNDFTDMKVAVEIILDAIAKGVKICIVGDYDVDGVTSSTIVASTLDMLGVEWTCIIPHRVEDGYGLSVKLVARAKELGCGLIITVDNGIRAVEAIDYAVELGMTVVLTDHHEPGDKLPEGASAIVHWAKSTHPESAHLSGAGVAWKLASALLNHAPSTHVPATEVQALRDWHCGLAAWGALADMMPMRGENRKLVRSGLEVLRLSRRPGWRTLCEVAKVNVAEITDTVLAWSVTPRLNAAGRMGTAEVAFRLLMTDDVATASEHAAQIESWNQIRKLETERVYQEAVEAFESGKSRAEAAMIVVSGVWNLGVVGIVAAKLVGTYGLPAIVLADDGSNVLKGSGRAPVGFPLHGTLLQCKEWMLHFGGHEAAVGCAVARDGVEEFRQAVDAIAGQTSAVPLSDGVLADDYLSLSDVNLETIQLLERFGPFGPQNPMFSFYIGPVEIEKMTALGNGKHLRIKVREGKNSSEMVWFQAPEEAKHWPVGKRIAAICRLEENTWQGVTRPQLRIETVYPLQEPLMRDDFAAIYRVLQARRRLTTQEATSLVGKHRHAEAQVIFDTFVELGFAHWQESAYHVVEQVASRDLRDSRSYQMHLGQSVCGKYL